MCVCVCVCVRVCVCLRARASERFYKFQTAFLITKGEQIDAPQNQKNPKKKNRGLLDRFHFHYPAFPFSTDETRVDSVRNTDRR